MKKFIAFLLAFNSFIAFSQDDSATMAPLPFSSSTAIKVNPLSYFLGNLNLGAEFNLRSKRSFTIGVGIPMERTQNVEIDEEEREIKIKTFSAMAGYRMYFGKKSMSGIYFEPFLKYIKTDIQTIVDGEIETVLGTEQTTFDITSNNSGFGLGAQLGFQFLIANRVSLDLFLLGPTAYISDNTITLRDRSATSDWSTVNEQEVDQQIRDNVRDVPVLGDMIADKLKITIDKNKKTGTAQYEGFLPGLRAGLSLGIRF